MYYCMQTHGKRKHEFLIIGPDIKSIDRGASSQFDVSFNFATKFLFRNDARVNRRHVGLLNRELPWLF